MNFCHYYYKTKPVTFLLQLTPTIKYSSSVFYLFLGMAECLLAAALARIGQKVLHLDRYVGYSFFLIVKYIDVYFAFQYPSLRGKV